MSEMTDFLKDFKAFKKLADEHEITNGEVIQLFAVYKKDKRETERYAKQPSNADNGSDSEDSITDNQKAYIRDLLDRAGADCDETEIGGMTKQEAIQYIGELLGGQGAG